MDIIKVKNFKKCKCKAVQLHVSRHAVDVQVLLNPHSTPALEGDGCPALILGCFNPVKEIRYPSYKRLVGARCRSGWVRKISPPPVFEPRTIQPVATRFTNSIPTT